MTAEPLASDLVEHLRVASIDPLRLDEPLSELPGINATGNTAEISKIATKAVDSAGRLDDLHPETAIACLRDLDFLASSLWRHGVEPMQAIDGLEDTMLRMGQAAGTVPRGTVATFAAANPNDNRRRSFTGSSEEDLFTNGLKESYGKLEIATQTLSSIDLSDPEVKQDLIAALQATSVGMNAMIDSVIEVRRNVSPEYFSDIMRPYFDSLHIGGEEYHAPNGGQLQLLALEAMLWDSDGKNAEWRDFFEANYPYLTPAQREALGNFEAQNGGQSVLSRVREDAKSGNIDTEVMVSLEEVVRKIRKFRYPHLKVTEDNFKLRPKGIVGSGSFTPAILRSLIEKTTGNLDAVKETHSSK